MRKPVLLYDADCGFCRWSVDRIVRWERRGGLRVVPIQSAEGAQLLDGMEPDRRLASWHFVSEDGAVRSAGAGAPPLLRLLPGGQPLAFVADLFPKTTDRLYRLVARNRERLGRLLGEQACSIDPACSRDRERA